VKSLKKSPNLPKGINYLGPNRYRVRIYYEGRQHGVGVFKTIGDAKAALAIAQSEKARGTFIPPSEKRANLKAQREAEKLRQQRDEKTVLDLGEAWLAWLERMQRSAGTIYTYRRHLEAYFFPEFGARPVTAITADEITQWYDKLRKDRGAGVAPRVYLTVAAMFRYGTGETKDLPRSFAPWLDESPADVPGGAKTETKTRTSDEPVATPAEIAQIAAYMPPREALGVLLAGWCALRIGEVLALRRRHVTRTGRGKSRVVWISIEEQVQARGSGPRLDPPKTTAGIRDVPVPRPLVPELEAHLKTYVGKDPESFLFPRHETGNQVHNPNTFRKHFNKARDMVNADSEKKPARLEGFTFHGLRHSCLTRLGQSGATLSDLMAFAGHSDIESVLVYQHSERERLASLADTMAESYETVEDQS
jgi:integrase